MLATDGTKFYALVVDNTYYKVVGEDRTYNLKFYDENSTGIFYTNKTLYMDSEPIQVGSDGIYTLTKNVDKLLWVSFSLLKGSTPTPVCIETLTTNIPIKTTTEFTIEAEQYTKITVKFSDNTTTVVDQLEGMGTKKVVTKPIGTTWTATGEWNWFNAGTLSAKSGTILDKDSVTCFAGTDTGDA